MAQVFEDSAIAVARWVESSLRDIARSATDAIWVEVPAYRSTPLYEDVVDHVVDIFGVFTSTVIERRAPSVADFAFTAAHATLRVESGILLVDFLKAFRIAQLALWRAIRGHAPETPASRSTALELVEHLMLTIEAGSTAAAISYLDAQQFQEADRERVARECLEELLDGRLPTHPARREALRAAGLDEGVRFAILVCRPAYAEGDHELSSEARRSFARIAAGLVTQWREQLVCVCPVPGADEQALIERVAARARELPGLGSRVSVGLGNAHPELTDAATALREAELACTSLRGRSGMQAIAKLSSLDYLVARADRSADVVVDPRVREFLAEDRANGSVYADTLHALARHDLNARRAAEALHIHVNTMYYRLGQIAKRTRLNVRRLDDAFELLIAIRLLEPRAGEARRD
jgi:sugar diacid utilization regulator